MYVHYVLVLVITTYVGQFWFRAIQGGSKMSLLSFDCSCH